MRLLIFSAVYHPFAGGYTESIHELAKRLVQKGCAVTVLTCNTHHVLPEEIIDDVRVVRMPCLNPKWLNNTFPIPLPIPQTFRLLKQTLRTHADIISTQTRFFPTSWLGFFIGKLKHIPLVHTERGATHSITSSRIISWLATLVDHNFGWVIARFSNATIGVSEASCVFLRHLGAKNPIKIYNGVDVEFWEKPISKINCQKSIVITFVGRLIYAKGVHDQLRAVTELKNVIVNIVGDGSYRKELEKLTQKLGLQNNVQFLGELTKEQVREILWQTDIFINPSHSEGLPRSVLEAAAVGLPIIATDVGGTKEILSTEDYGILIPPKNPKILAEKLTLLINDNNIRKRLGANAQRSVRENFDWEKITNQYLRLLEQMTYDKLQG